MKRTYEILGYKTNEDFTSRNFTTLDLGITRKREAVSTAKELYNNKPYAIIKVQSNDREFIQILSKLKDNY